MEGCVWVWSVTQSQTDRMRLAYCNDIFRSSWISFSAGLFNEQTKNGDRGTPAYDFCPSPAQGTILCKDNIDTGKASYKEKRSEITTHIQGCLQ